MIISKNEDRVGYFVDFSGDKIVIANTESDCCGIVSKTSCVVGNSAEKGWVNANKTTEFGELETVDNYRIPMEPILAAAGLKYVSDSRDLQAVIDDNTVGQGCVTCSNCQTSSCCTC